MAPLVSAWPLEADQHRLTTTCEGRKLVRHHARVEAVEDLSAVESVVFLRRHAIEPGARCQLAVFPEADRLLPRRKTGLVRSIRQQSLSR